MINKHRKILILLGVFMKVIRKNRLLVSLLAFVVMSGGNVFCSAPAEHPKNQATQAQVSSAASAALSSSDEVPQQKDMQSALAYFTDIGNAPMLAKLLKDPVHLQMLNVHQTGSGNVPLTDAAVKGYEDCAILLLDAGALIHEKDSGGATPFMRAAFNGHFNIVKLLYSRAKVEDRRQMLEDENNAHCNALTLAAGGLEPDIVAFLIDKGSPGIDMALQVAQVLDQRPELLQYFQEEHPELSIDQLKQSNQNIIRLLQDAKEKKEKLNKKVEVSRAAPSTALSSSVDASAASSSSAQPVQSSYQLTDLTEDQLIALLDAGKLLPTVTDGTWIIVAAKIKSKPLLQRLLEHPTYKKQINKPDVEHKQSPLSWCAIVGFTDGLDLLIQAGAQVNYKDPEGMTPFMKGVVKGDFEVVKQLFNSPNNKTPKNKKDFLKITNGAGWNALMLAAQGASPEIVRYLIDSGSERLQEALACAQDMNKMPEKYLKMHPKRSALELHQVNKIITGILQDAIAQKAAEELEKALAQEASGSKQSKSKHLLAREKKERAEQEKFDREMAQKKQKELQERADQQLKIQKAQEQQAIQQALERERQQAAIAQAIHEQEEKKAQRDYVKKQQKNQVALLRHISATSMRHQSALNKEDAGNGEQAFHELQELFAQWNVYCKKYISEKSEDEDQARALEILNDLEQDIKRLQKKLKK